MDLTLEELRYIQDEDYYVDIEEWLKKDLYEKQRKIDNFVIEHEQERKELLGYYENIYYKATPNKYIHHIYVNTYNLSRIRTSLAMGLFSASFATVALGFINPALPLLLFYDYYKIISYMLLLNRVIISIRISKGKTQIRVDTLNYLGYMRKPDGRFHNITSLKYIQPYVNNCLNPNQIGLLPSLSLAKRWLMKVFKKDESTSAYEKRVRKTNGEFKKFHKVNIQNRNFYLPNDMLEREASILDEQLLLNVIHGDQMNVYQYDFSSREETIDVAIEESKEILDDMALQSHRDIFSEEKRKKRAYMKYHPNRDFEERFKEQLKKTWGDQDEDIYVDNGYR